jgi:hypothetical protein
MIRGALDLALRLLIVINNDHPIAPWCNEGVIVRGNRVFVTV